eukprot:6515869-Prymnesium_polylepis.1
MLRLKCAFVELNRRVWIDRAARRVLQQQAPVESTCAPHHAVVRGERGALVHPTEDAHRHLYAGKIQHEESHGMARSVDPLHLERRTASTARMVRASLKLWARRRRHLPADGVGGAESPTAAPADGAAAARAATAARTVGEIDARDPPPPPVRAFGRGRRVRLDPRRAEATQQPGVAR